MSPVFLGKEPRPKGREAIPERLLVGSGRATPWRHEGAQVTPGIRWGPRVVWRQRGSGVAPVCHEVRLLGENTGSSARWARGCYLGLGRRS